MMLKNEGYAEDLPRLVAGVEINDPVITLFGLDWSLNISCPWKAVVSGGYFTWEDMSFEDKIQKLVGSDLTSLDLGDSCDDFNFTKGKISAFPDTDWDPWVLILPSGMRVGRCKEV